MRIPTLIWLILSQVHSFVPLDRVTTRKGTTDLQLLPPHVDIPTTHSSNHVSLDNKYCIPLEQVSLPDLPLVGGKTASLGEMIQHLTHLGIAVPGGFAVTSAAYDAVLDRFELRSRLQQLLKDLDATDLESLADIGRQARSMIIQAGLPYDVHQAIVERYASMHSDNECSVAVRSSATAEDLPTASFAGQQETFLNVVGANNVANAVLQCLASVFTDRAITYRAHNEFDHMSVKGAVVVQHMVRSDLGSAGVAFTLDPDTGFPDVVVITGSYGLGENVVGGKVDPDEVQVFKPMIGKVPDPIIRRRIGRKQTTAIYSQDVSHPGTKTIQTTEQDQQRPCFTDDEAKQLAKWCVDIEKHYSTLHGHWTPMDIEWAKDGENGKLFIVQARPETVRSRQVHGAFTQTLVSDTGPTILQGTAIGSDAASGNVVIIQSPSEISKMQPNAILVADMTDPDWVPAIRMASAVVTNRGGRTCHAAIISRELGVPCIVGTKDATEILRTGDLYTVDCSQGITGRIYEGFAKIDRKIFDSEKIPTTKTEVKLILADPDAALAYSSLPVAGVGLVRQEFVIANHIGVHPNAVLFPEKVDGIVLHEIYKRSQNDACPVEWYVRKLSEGIGSIAAAFYPRPVLVRLGDFKSNEYNRLMGGTYFEPMEENPMLGLRGASRYLHPDFKDAFDMECKALCHVRNNMGLTNVDIMIPFCRTTEEGKLVIGALEKNGLKRGDNDLKIWVMCEVPANVLVIDEFAEIFDGFSIGSNDLTQLVLGVDRDSADLANMFDEENTAVKTAIRRAIHGAHRNHKEVGICGQAPSDKPDFAGFLVRQGIDSISITPDSVFRAIHTVADAERRLTRDDYEALSKEIGARLSSETSTLHGEQNMKQRSS